MVFPYDGLQMPWVDMHSLLNLLREVNEPGHRFASIRVHVLSIVTFLHQGVFVCACATHLTIFSGVIGNSSILTPKGLSASSTARVTAGGATIRPPSPPPLTPYAVKGEGVTW